MMLPLVMIDAHEEAAVFICTGLVFPFDSQ
jgi:hypothetical protein